MNLMKEDSGMRYSPDVISADKRAIDIENTNNNRSSIHSGTESTTKFNGEAYPSLNNNGHTNSVFMTDEGHLKVSHQETSADGDRTAL